ncbi:30S ribosomal protein S12 methylthiotransferase RimO [Intestinimonas butyriciproducens]|uniref:30S ribosomal protein S12 methylthiotransferase RimO n=1 Tax=Intestinimonas butyriciproducens TaxID=1297617 RepID=UPI00242DFCB2|nr:30S ribosomal protein S12 methylthiotransferase RimO [Intestinimonas butyriciproducens]MCI6362760.1 30S ribosomal protein S12 methylthiotransferase RimO [Intestinimonas butyriciproducens]MDY3616933.1 30S ribosomal protein S12 methylthiotransferase RimO [Intestinimonas butyriciproducens]
MKVAFISLGCAKNLVNTEQMMALCQEAGYTVTGEPEGADVAVVNTCGFIDSAKSEAIDTILSIAPLKEQGRLGKLLVAGCLTQRYQDEILEELPEVDGILGTGSYTDIVPAIEAVLEGDTPTYFGDIDHTIEDGKRLVSTPAYTAYLKIAEGCDNRCAYCVIPYLRGRYRSRPMESLLEEARGLAEGGVRELMVIAQDITRYGTDLYGKRRLAELLRELCRMDFHWIRLHYLYPDEIDQELIDVIAEEPKIVKYLDIPIQHLSDKILRAMNRRGNGALISDVISTLREDIPDLVLRTSIIVGFPGEGEEEFEELCRLLPGYHFQRAGVFTFSAEEGAPAAAMPDQVPEDVAKHRMELLVDLQSRVMDQWNEDRLGTVMEVLCEGFDGDMGCWVGRTYADSPDIDGHVYFTAAGQIPAGTFVNVRITGTSDGDLTGEIEE